MDLVTPEMQGYLANSSAIRKMFEAGIELRKKYGAENVYDFSLGNPDLPPPAKVADALKDAAGKAGEPFSIGYMPNAGYPALREKMAAKLAAEQQVPLKAEHVLMTCGAAGGINVFFRATLNAGDEVLTPSPYFVEYGFYAGHTGGKLVPVPTMKDTFSLDIDAFAAAVNERTRAVIINSPNNPTGVIYTRRELEKLAAVLNAAEDRYGKPIFVVADEPYRCLNFDGVEIPSLLSIFRHSVVIGSFSKSLSLAGERIGFIAVRPDMEGGATLMNALILCNRILGFVNAPALAQQILLSCLDEEIDLDIYRRRRQAMAEVLDAAGIEYQMPRGAFYFFPKVPVADEAKFFEAMTSECVLVVPGKSFGLPGHFRMTFCVDEDIIRRSGPGIARAVAKVRG